MNILTGALLCSGAALLTIAPCWKVSRLLAEVRRERLKTRIVVIIGNNRVGNTTAANLARQLRLDVDSPQLNAALAALLDENHIVAGAVGDYEGTRYYYQLKRSA